VGGPRSQPHALERRSIELWDPEVPDSKQPYHAALELRADEGARVVEAACRAVQNVATRALRALLADLRQKGHEPRGIGLVVGSDADPEKLANPHIRAHALEGRLFWRVLEVAAGALGLPCLAVTERDLFSKGAAALGRPADELKRIATDLGRPVGRPWGAEEKTAVLAAWMALVR
jgi:hypothetical protein